MLNGIGLKSWLRKLSASTSGNLAIMSALVMMPILAFVGGAVDYSFVYAAKMNMERAANAAVIAAVSDAKEEAKSLTDTEIKKLMESSINQVFTGSLSNVIDIGSIEMNATVDIVKNVMHAKMDFEYQQKTFFLGAIGIKNIGLKGGAEAKSSIGNFTEFSILADVSNSMGVGADQSDIDYLNANNVSHGKSCAFACHDNIHRIRKMPVKVRIDVARDAIKSALQVVDEKKHPDGVVKFGLYTFDQSVQTIFTPAHADSSNIGWIKQKVDDNVDLKRHGHSRSDFALGELAKMIPASGVGKTENSPKRYVLMISDGVQWIAPNWPDFNRNAPVVYWGWGHAQAPSPDACDALKQKGITVYVLYTTYIPIYNGSGTDRLSRDIGKVILPVNQERLRKCASTPEKFFEAKSSSDIKKAMEAIFTEVAIPTHVSG